MKKKTQANLFLFILTLLSKNPNLEDLEAQRDFLPARMRLQPAKKARKQMILMFSMTLYSSLEMNSDISGFGGGPCIGFPCGLCCPHW